MLRFKNKVSPRLQKLANEYEDAYEYFISAGMIENLHGNDAYYVEQLINYIEELRLLS